MACHGLARQDHEFRHVKEPIGARERRTGERKARQASERERRKDRKRAGSPAMPAAAWPATRIRANARPQTRRPGARGAG